MKTIQLAVWLLLGSVLHAQIPASLNVTSFTDFNYENVEPSNNYNFGYPVYADVLSQDPNTYQPEFDNRYFMSTFGPRHKEVETSNIGFFDYHKGSDITADVSFGGVTYSENNAPDIHCVCDGVVYEVFTGPDPESTGTGVFVTVKCDSSFHANPSWGNVYTAYRHLASVTNGLQVGDTLSIGDVVGVMGESGHTSTVHLHFSVIRLDGGHETNVHPERIFNPDSIPHLLNHLTTAEITQLKHTADEALFRIAVPYNMASIRALKVSLPNGLYEKTYDFEVVSELPEDDRDDNDAVDGLELFAYPFNRGHVCYQRVWDKYKDGEITTHYPACPDLGAGNFYPFLSEGLHQTPAYVLDLKVKDLPLNYDIEDLNIQLIDVWGYGVQANGVNQASDEHFAWAMITDEDDDAEEYENGTVDLTDGDLELVYDYSSHGNQTVGLLFPDLSIPNSATITDAFLQFRADASHSDVVNLVVKAEDTGNSADFTTANQNISGRDTTYASAIWQPAPWTIDDMGADQKCTGLAEVVQEVVTTQNWTTDSPLAFLITGTGRREAEGYSSSLWKNAYVYIEYTDEMALPPNEPPTVTLTAPSDGAIYLEPDTILLSADANDPNGNLSAVEFFVNDISIGVLNGSPYELSWEIPDYGSYTIKAVASDDEGLTASSATATISVLANEIDIQISDKNDDVEELENGIIWKTNSDLELCYDDYVSNSDGLVGHQHIGLRFQNVTVPQGASISNAYIQFTTDETDSDATEIVIRAENVDNASAFSYAAFNVSSRTMTTDSVSWNPPAWNSVGAAGADERTPNISQLIQTVVDRNGWSSGNSMVLILYGWDQLKRVAESYDGSVSGAAVLHIEFSENTQQNLSVNQTEAFTNMNSFRVFPNPVHSGFLTIEFLENNAEASHIEITDMMGRIMATKQRTNAQSPFVRFETRNRTPGTYVVKVWNDQSMIGVQKIVVD